VRLRQAIAGLEVGGHLERVYLGVRLPTEHEQFPDRHTERPLHSDHNISLRWHENDRNDETREQVDIQEKESKQI